MTKKLFVVAVFALYGGVALGQSTPSIQGAWRLAEVNKSPQPGLYVFTEKHYSIMWDTSREVRPSISDPANITAAEALATFGPFMAQSGTYEATGTTLRVTPIVAKVPPPNGKYGGSNRWTLKLDGDMLWLTQIDDLRERLTGTAGKTPNPTTVRLVRVE